MTMRKVNYS